MKCLRNLLKSEKKRAQAVRFAIVGGIATAIQYLCYLAFVAICGLAAPISSMIGYAISMVCNFFMSSVFTFHAKPTTGRAAPFAMSHLANFIMQTLLVTIFARIMAAEWALLPAMAICLPVNFILVRLALTSKHFGK